jgi:hypothetical protein
MDAPLDDGLIEELPFSVSIEWDARGDLVSDPPASAIWWGQLTGQSAEELSGWGWLEVARSPWACRTSRPIACAPPEASGM